MQVLYTVTEKFSPKDGAGWEKYIRWARLPQLKEIIGLDCSLSPSFFVELLPEDWNFNIQKDYFISYFNNLEYVIGRINKQIDIYNLLAVVYEPETNPSNILDDKRFVFYGYDLIGRGSCVSALTNCGGFEKAFDNTQLSSVGLLERFSLAREVQARLRQYYPDEYHADCDVWAIWRMEKLIPNP